MTAILLAVSAFAFWVMALAFLAGPPVGHLRFNEWHHGYLGILLATAGWLTGWVPLSVAGVICCVDDGWQHAVQRTMHRHDYRSPLHRVYGLLYRIPLVRRLNAWLDTRLK